MIGLTLSVIVVLYAWRIIANSTRPAQNYDPPLTAAEVQRKQKAQRAESDYDRLTAQRETVLALCEAIERELTTCTTDKRRTQLLSKLVTTENRLASIDRRREKAFKEVYT